MTKKAIVQTLFGIFFTFFVVQYFLLIECRRCMWPDELQGLLFGVFKIYAVPLSIILAGHFPLPRNSGLLQSKVTALIAISVSAMWNIILLVNTAGFVFQKEVEAVQLLKNLNESASNGAFLIAGMLMYFFRVELRQP